MSIDWSRPVRRKGDKELVRVLCIDAPGKQPVIALYETGRIHRYSIDGTYWNEKDDCDLDLENVPEERYVWVNIYTSPSGFDGFAHPSRADADASCAGACVDEGRVACIKVKIEEGRFDD